MMLVPMLAFAAAPWTTCTGGPLVFLYATYLPVLIRSKWIEYGLLQQLEVQFSFSMLFESGVGILEHMDWLIDGALQVQTAMCDPEAMEPWASSFRICWRW